MLQVDGGFVIGLPQVVAESSAAVAVKYPCTGACECGVIGIVGVHRDGTGPMRYDMAAGKRRSGQAGVGV